MPSLAFNCYVVSAASPRLGFNMCTFYTLGQSSVKWGGAEHVTLLSEGSGSHLSAM